MKNLFATLAVLASGILLAQTVKKKDRTIYVNGTIYTVDSAFSRHEAMVVENGKIIAIGKSGMLSKGYSPASVVDLKGKFVYPGFIDAHCHFFGLGVSMQIVDLVGTKSAEEVVERCQAFAKLHPEKKYIMGRGWDQNDWVVKEYPDKLMLDKAFPNIPVVLKRIDGHAAWVNSQTLNQSRVNAQTRVEGGEVLLLASEPSGILVDNAVDLIMGVIPAMTKTEIEQACMLAQDKCLSNGITTLVDAGLELDTFNLIKAMIRDKRLKVSLSMMDASSSKFWGEAKKYSEFMKNRHVKVYLDGALGSRGALLKLPYTDQPGSTGLLLTDSNELRKIARLCYQHRYQLNVHCIGDAAVNMCLRIMGEQLQGPNDRRWRIEHCQVVATEDLPLFTRYSIIPSVQPTHATSDMYWATDRLGPERIKTAYAFADLLKYAGYIALGTDFPVESVSPLYTFAAAVWRMDAKEYPTGGFQAENALTRQQALRGMTIWAARSVFEEEQRGSLEKGKAADFVILDQDLMTCTFQQVRNAQVLATYVAGKKVF